MAARACAEAQDPKTVKKLDDAMTSIEKAYLKKSTSDVLKATTVFYRTLFEGADKTVAWTIVNSLTARINHLRGITTSTPGRERDGPAHMRKIVEAIRLGNGEAASKASLEHVRSAAVIAHKILSQADADLRNSA